MSERLNEGYEYCERLGPEADARTLLAYLTRRDPHSSRTEWAARIASDHVLIDGRPAHADSGTLVLLVQ